MFADAIQMHIPKYVLTNALVLQITIERIVICFNQFSKFLKSEFLSKFLLPKNFKKLYGGARRDRTADLLRAKQALSQLSYGPSIVRTS